jgi:hypothetical protein
MKSPKAPAAPSADQLSAANKQTTAADAAANRVNQKDQFGNTLNYSQTGTDAYGNPTFTANQQLGATGQQYASGLTGLGQSYFDKVNAGADLNSMDAFNKAQGFWSANAEPRFEQQRASMENRLRNQGLDPTSEAYKSAANDQALQQNEARNQFMTTAQGQFFNQGLQGRQQELRELQPGMDFGTTATNPQYVTPSNVNTGNAADALQTGYNNQYKQYQDKLAQQNAMWGGLAGLGGALLNPLGTAVGTAYGNKYV